MLPMLDKTLTDFGIASQPPQAGERAGKTSDDDPLVLQALHTDDDPTLNPRTLRMLVLGIGLSVFGSALVTIFLFKPQSVSVSVIFLAVISYVLGNGMALLPRKYRLLNPHAFNSKENLAITIMSSSASSAAYATLVLAAQKLYYNVVPSPVVSTLLLFSSQLLGYGMAGVLRRSLVYPNKMMWPSILPLTSLVETLHRDRGEMKERFRFFWAVFGAVAVWELFPQNIIPALTGVSIFCLANRNSLVFTNVFGSASGNEGLGLLSLSFDWQYITTTAFSLPARTLANGFAGYVLCMCLFLGLYYGNVWHALQFPFLSQSLFANTSTPAGYVVYNQTAILDGSFELDTAALAVEGLPFFAVSNASYLLMTNLGIMATIMHIYLWHYDSVKAAFSVDFRVTRPTLSSFKNVSRKRKASADSRDNNTAAAAETDPHYLKMLAYREVPLLWYVAVLVVSTAVALGCIYNLNSTLPWWGFAIATTLSFTATLFFGALQGLIGFGVPIMSLIYVIGGNLHPGKPALSLVDNLKLGQYGKLSPRCTFSVTLVGTLLGAIVNYVIQSFNSNAIAFSALTQYMFGVGRIYPWILLALPVDLVLPVPFYLLYRLFPGARFDLVLTPVIAWYLGYLSVGINASVTVYFAPALFVHAYVSRKHAAWFMRYNFVLAAAISGGTELLVFVTTFAVQGGSGTPVPFPPYWGNKFQSGNFDSCTVNPGLA
ncbi:opt oligopeptide transporter [Ophiostoma piceae UAMH 11346]|uniref:Opt oligopeptide transporter n=1 Tax=Ophiostoma piceae (strain UAMH 11346) TaxID=1262450 RepID=S3BTE2_OPHP1|nr:opt oligopeptide transporter [Ophiostoma piceae UAMH 11346]